MVRRKKDPILAAMKAPQDFLAYLEKLGMPGDDRNLPWAGDLQENDFPNRGDLDTPMSLEQYAATGRYSGLVKSASGVHRQSTGGAVADPIGGLNFEPAPSTEWTRSVAFLQVIAGILLVVKADPQLFRHQRRHLKQLGKDIPDYSPRTELPIFPAQLGTPDQFLEQWKDGYIDVITEWLGHSERRIVITSTGLREHEESLPAVDPDDALPEPTG